MWIDKNGRPHVEDQHDPSTLAENNPGSVDWEATKRYKKLLGRRDMSVRQKSVKSKSVRVRHSKPKEPPKDDRIKLLDEIWGKRRITRLNQVIKQDFCGVMTVREFVAIVLGDKNSFPRGLDTWLSIGDFEGNFCTNVLSVRLGGTSSDHVCLCGDPHFDQI